MDLQKINTEELLKLKNEVIEEIRRRELDKTAVVWGMIDEKKKKSTPSKKQAVRSEFYFG